MTAGEVLSMDVDDNEGNDALALDDASDDACALGNADVEGDALADSLCEADADFDVDALALNEPDAEGSVLVVSDAWSVALGDPLKDDVAEGSGLTLTTKPDTMMEPECPGSPKYFDGTGPNSHNTSCAGLLTRQ